MTDELLNTANALVTDPIDETEARFIAQDWHGGQWSNLYGFQSSGKLTDPIGLASEVEHCYRFTLPQVQEVPELNRDGESEYELLSLYQWILGTPEYRRAMEQCEGCGAELYRNRAEHDPACSIEPICLECGKYNPVNPEE